jgi:hypothetical protein
MKDISLLWLLQRFRSYGADFLVGNDLLLQKCHSYGVWDWVIVMHSYKNKAPIDPKIGKKTKASFNPLPSQCSLIPALYQLAIGSLVLPDIALSLFA